MYSDRNIQFVRTLVLFDRYYPFGVLGTSWFAHRVPRAPLEYCAVVYRKIGAANSKEDARAGSPDTTMREQTSRAQCPANYASNDANCAMFARTYRERQLRTANRRRRNQIRGRVYSSLRISSYVDVPITSELAANFYIPGLRLPMKSRLCAVERAPTIFANLLPERRTFNGTFGTLRVSETEAAGTLNLRNP